MIALFQREADDFRNIVVELEKFNKKFDFFFSFKSFEMQPTKHLWSVVLNLTVQFITKTA